MSRATRLFAALLLCVLQFSAPAGPLEAKPKSPMPAAAHPLKRDILGLYDGTSETAAKTTRLHRYLEMPLNHLGYRLTLHDISKGLPPLAELAAYHAIATWFSGEVVDARNYLQWATKVARSGTRFVVLDSVGLLGSKDEIPTINAFLGELGVSYAEYFVSDSRESRIRTTNDAMIGFEAKLDPIALPGHQVAVPTSPKTTVHLSVADPAHRWVHAPYSALVTTGPRGGFASSGFVMHYDTERKISRWIINPFAFLEAALDGGLRPIPDTTTISGRRIYFSHIDGDGWNNATTVQPHAERREISAAVVLNKLIAPYPDLPVSVGLIAGDADPTHGGTDQAAEIARRMYRLPQVEAASHTHTHPYKWSLFETYDRKAEIARVLKFGDVKPEYDDRSLAALIRRWRNQVPAPVERSGEVAQSSEDDAILPRSRPEQPFSLATEVKGALDRTSRLAPKEKPSKLYLWSGDTTPFEAAVRATREAGARNINGGDSRFDSSYPSVAYVAPVGIAVGAERQIYAVNSNENTYTNGWTGPFDAFRQLTETLDNTERPRRLKAFNLYYHSFSATRQEGVDAIVTHLDRARHDAVTPIKASHYAAIADGFYTAEITQIAPQRWRIANRGALDTLRFDNAGDLTIDYSASIGVVGHHQHQGSLYVSLDSSMREATIATTPANSVRPTPPRTHLIESRWLVSGLEHSSCKTRVRVEGFGKGGFTWGGLPVGRHEVTITREEKVLHRETLSTDANGTLAFTAPVDAIEPPLALTITCSDPLLAGAAPIATKAVAKTRPTRTFRRTPPTVSRSPPTAGAQAR